MGMGVGEWSMFPNGNIKVSSIVKIDTTKSEGYVIQAAADTDDCFGIAGPEPHIMAVSVQGVQLDDGLAGVAGGPAIKVYGPGATMVPVRVGNTAVAVGDRLVSDANGDAVTTTSDKKKVIAVARQGGAANTVILCDVMKYDTSV